jgi:hypothetical protein
LIREKPREDRKSIGRLCTNLTILSGANLEKSKTAGNRIKMNSLQLQLNGRKVRRKMA